MSLAGGEELNFFGERLHTFRKYRAPERRVHSRYVPQLVNGEPEASQDIAFRLHGGPSPPPRLTRSMF